MGHSHTHVYISHCTPPALLGFSVYFITSIGWNTCNHDVGGFPSQLILGCRWYALLLARSVNIQLALCGAGSGALDVTGRRLIAMAGRLIVEIG
jgi:hypothetical protein